MTLEGMFSNVCIRPSDINEHLPELRRLASECISVIEFGMRDGNSTTAILAGQPKTFTTYDIKFNDEVFSRLKRVQGKTKFGGVEADVLKVEIPLCDMLFIDTYHTYTQLKAELERHAEDVRRWIVLHDTETFGIRGEDGMIGLNAAISEFLVLNPEWTVRWIRRNNNGLTLLERT